jgi:CheY-like chemotaxis protein
MGLATVYGVVKQHGGWIEVESTPSRGTVIRTFFPPSVNGVAPEVPASHQALTCGAPTENITILAVEDEEMLRDFVEQALNALGYRVLTARNGRDALKVWAEHRDEIDLLLTDVVMPESISGRQLAHALTADKPRLKVIFTSGYSAELLGTDFEQEKQYRFLPKPYLPERLASTIAEHLQQPASGLN